ncbi:MAG: hypothetical protein CL897_02290 [Dehalococcoidia bacterium]|nr:hypothetical protein [Dehalococcoidia bacterium]|tara:strand:+ start:5377 stop:5889 length:513 start_codon:yes stop_codon:yes gene_type:complete
MELLELIASLESLVVQARRLPVGGNLVIERRVILDLVDQLRLAVPDNVRQAAQILEQREQLLRDAKEHGQALIEEAEERRKQLVSETIVVQQAESRAQEILMEAEARARQTIADADATAAAHLSEAAEAAAKQLQEADRYAVGVIERLQADIRTVLDALDRSSESLQESR